MLLESSRRKLMLTPLNDGKLSAGKAKFPQKVVLSLRHSVSALLLQEAVDELISCKFRRTASFRMVNHLISDRET